MKRTQVKIFCKGNTNELQNVINKFLDYEYDRCRREKTSLEIVDIKMTEVEDNITATIIYKIGC